jgi:hypothetical protein
MSLRPAWHFVREWTCYLPERKDLSCASDRLRSCFAYSLRSMPSPLLGIAIAIALPSALTARDRLAMVATSGAQLPRTTSSVSIRVRLTGDPAARVPDTSSITSIRSNAGEQMHRTICSGRRCRMGKRRTRQSATADCKQAIEHLIYIVRVRYFRLLFAFPHPTALPCRYASSSSST